jgi:hypothetical protein
MTLEVVRAVADAVLFEGGALSSALGPPPKSQLGRQYGVLAPRAWSEGGGGDPWWQETHVLVELPVPRYDADTGTVEQDPVDRPTRIEGRLRFLRRSRLALSHAVGTPWEEGELQEIDFGFDLPPSLAFVSGGVAEQVIPFRVEGAEKTHDGITRRSSSITGLLRVNLAAVVADRPVVRASIRVENLTTWTTAGAPRDEALGGSLLGTHVLLSMSGGGEFISLVDPPEWAAAAATTCHNVGTYPVLVGPEGCQELVLSAPVLLYDHPMV